MLRRRRRAKEGGKDCEAQGTHHESIPTVGSSEGRPERRIGGGTKLLHLQWRPAVVGKDSGREEPVWRFGKVEGVPRKISARGIEVWWPEEGDRRGGVPAGRAHELRSALDEVRRKRGVTGGSHDYPDKYMGDAWRIVRRPLADCPRGRCYSRVAHIGCGEDAAADVDMSRGR